MTLTCDEGEDDDDGGKGSIAGAPISIPLERDCGVGSGGCGDAKDS